MVSCSSEDIPLVSTGGNEFAYVVGDDVVVNMALEFPDAVEIQTRALEYTPDYNDMHLYLVEFDDNGSPLRNTLKTVYTPEIETTAGNKVVYKVKLTASEQPRVLHLIAIPKEQVLNIDYGIEAVVIPNLKTQGGVPAYWRRLSFPDGYASGGSNGSLVPTSDIEKLRHVALVRNFSRITMSNNASGFELKGFAIVNNPQQGSIAPWSASGYFFPEFLYDGDPEDENYQTQKPFEDINATYSGFTPAGLTFSNLESNPEVPVEEEIAPKYLYERQFNSIRHTYVILRGRRATDDSDSYYKLDLGKNDSQGVFKYYGILRNFSYNITINSVEQKGYDTAAAAAKGVVYNNFSFDIELSSMLNISDGDEIVFVNFTTKVLTESVAQTIEFKYRYKKGNEYLNTPTFNGGNVNFIGLEKGPVISDVKYGTSDGSAGWRSVFITCYPAEPETKSQSFTIVKPSGLGRTVNLILHQKWTLQNVKEFPEILENWNVGTPDEGEVGEAVGSDFTIFFDVPDNLEEAMFPLVFTLESDRQNMENNPLGALVVTSGPSGFSGVLGNRIKYEKSVTWTQYNDPLTSDPYDNGTAIDNGDGTFTHRVRCRFRTTTDLTDLPFDQSTTRVLITNDNFNNAIVTFNREI